MAHRPRVLSEGEHPIHLYETDDVSAKLIVNVAEAEAEGSQAWSESQYESAVSSPSDELFPDPRLGGDEIESSPAALSASGGLLAALKFTKRNSAAARWNRNLGDDLLSSAHTSSTGDQSDKSPESYGKAEPEYDSSPSSHSSDSDDAESDADLQVAQTGQQFEDRDRHVADAGADSDIDLDAVKQTDSKASAAAVAPFREGGLPNIARTYLTAGEPSEITDFGELIYAKSGKTRPRKPGSSNLSRSDGRRSAKKTLQQRLFSALQLTHQGKKDFFPRIVLSTIVTEQCVREELYKHLDRDVHQKDIAKYAREICEEREFEYKGVKKIKCFRKIFVILVLIEKTPAILKFLEKGVNDSDLPLEKVERQHERGAYDLRLSRNTKKRLRCFNKEWNQLHIRNFGELQWATLSPFFGKGGHKEVKHYPLQDQVILPFIEVATRRDRTNTYRTLEFEGGFGRVFKVDIHPDHHNFDHVKTNTKNQSFAIKCLHSPDKEQFKKEVEMLKKFSNPAHEHLISLLATYEQFKSYFLIFHWAEADLQRYWRDINPTPIMDRQTVLWVAKQCKGIADGIMTIHQYTTTSSKLRPQPSNKTFGHHGDIKPENVLWFPDPDHEKTKRGTLKLSDFGLAEFSIHHTVSMQPKSSFATSPPYRAPEIDLEGTGAIGRSYDMWTLGCLYLEFITWLIGGWDLVDIFAFKRMEPDPLMLGQCTRTFFRLVKVKTLDGKWTKSAEIKPAVTKFIEEELYAHESCTKFLRDFLDMVQNNLLVIQTHDRRKRDRPTCQEVYAKLCTMLRKCEADEEYACEPAPSLDAVDGKSGEGRQSEEYWWVDTVNLPEAGSLGVSDIKQF